MMQGPKDAPAKALVWKLSRKPDRDGHKHYQAKTAAGCYSVAAEYQPGKGFIGYRVTQSVADKRRSGSRHGVGDLFTALRRQGPIADELVLQLATFLRSLDLFLELIVLAPRTLTANQVRHGGKQGADNPEHSRIHSSTCPALTSLPRSFRAQRVTISLTSRSFLERKPLRQQRSPPSEPLPLANP